MNSKAVLIALALLGVGGVVAACEEETPLEDAAEDVGDATEDAVDNVN